MKWTTMFDDNYVKIESTFAGGAYTRVPALVRVTDKTGEEASVSMVFAIFNQSATYIFDQNHAALIDLSDFISVCELDVFYNVQLTIGEQTRTIILSVKGSLSVEDTIVPSIARIWNTKEGIGEAMLIAPPLRFQLPPERFMATYPQPIVELYIRNSYTDMRYDGDQLSVGMNYISGDPLDETSLIENIAADTSIEIPHQPAICDRRYAFVKWQSRYGGYKCHVWEIRDYTSSVSDVVSIISPYNIPQQLKTYQEEFTLRLDNLTEYDYWYYADIITSDDVRVIMADGESDVFDEYSRVVVSNSDYSLPSPKKTDELNINVIWAKRKI